MCGTLYLLWTQLRCEAHDLPTVLESAICNLRRVGINNGGLLMRMRITCNLTTEQEAGGYDVTLATLHKRFIETILDREWQVVGTSMFWHETEDGMNHLVDTIEVDNDADHHLDKALLDTT